jgi:hypothetical protein
MHHLTPRCKVCFFRETILGYEEYSFRFGHLLVFPEQLQIPRRVVLGVGEDTLPPLVLSLVLSLVLFASVLLLQRPCHKDREGLWKRANEDIGRCVARMAVPQSSPGAFITNVSQWEHSIMESTCDEVGRFTPSARLSVGSGTKSSVNCQELVVANVTKENTMSLRGVTKVSSRCTIKPEYGRILCLVEMYRG